MRIASFLAASVVAIGLSVSGSPSQAAQISSSPLQQLQRNQSLMTQPVGYVRHCVRWRHICARRWGWGGPAIPPVHDQAPLLVDRKSTSTDGGDRVAIRYICLFMRRSRAASRLMTRSANCGSWRMTARNADLSIMTTSVGSAAIAAALRSPSSIKRHFAEDATWTHILQNGAIGDDVDPAGAHHVHGVGGIVLEKDLFAGFEMTVRRADLDPESKTRMSAFHYPWPSFPEPPSRNIKLEPCPGTSKAHELVSDIQCAEKCRRDIRSRRRALISVRAP